MSRSPTKKKKPTIQRSESQPRIEVKLSAPELRKLTFVKHGPKPLAGSQIELRYGLGVKRHAENRLGVELSLESDGPQVEFHATYRAIFTLEQSEGSSAPDWTKELGVVATEIAPSILFPFVREAVMSTAIKAGVRSLVPPIVNFRQVFGDVEVTIPDAPSAQLEAGSERTVGSSSKPKG